MSKNSFIADALDSIESSYFFKMFSNRYSDRTFEFSILFSNSSLPSFSSKLDGSSPSGKNINFIFLPSLNPERLIFKADSAAFTPASSPSKQNMTSST